MNFSPYSYAYRYTTTPGGIDNELTRTILLPEQTLKNEYKKDMGNIEICIKEMS